MKKRNESPPEAILIPEGFFSIEPYYATIKTYIIWRKDADTIKIGISQTPHSRLKQLEYETGSKLEMIHIFDMNIESLLHTTLAEYKIASEWFQPTSKVLYKIGKILKKIEIDFKKNCEYHG